MRKFLLLTLAILFSALGAFSQAVHYYDTFESYAVGDYIAVENPTWWTTWSGAPGTGEDGIISNNFGTQSVLIDEDPGASDLILKLGDKTSGAWEVSWDMYVETGYAGYFNFQHFESPGIEWANEAYFLEDGTGELYAGSSTPINFTYPKDVWFPVVTFINLDADLAMMYVDGFLVHTWPFSNEASSTGGTLQLGGVDFFAGAVTGETPLYYFDNVIVQEVMAAFYEDDFDSYTAGEYIAVVNPTWWDTWSGLPGSGEDGLISDAMSNTSPNSILVDEDPGATDLILKLGDRTSGSYRLTWYMYVETGFGGYYNFQHFESPGIEWAFEVYMLEDGTGELYNGSSTPVNFSYPKDTWFLVRQDINLDADNIDLYINGVHIDSWPFSNEASSTGGTLQLGGIDFFAGAVTGESPKYYFDDLVFEPLPTNLYEDDLEDYNVGDFMAVVNPTWWTTWSGLPGSSEDAPIVDDYASSPTNSFIVEGSTDLILKLGDRVSGAYDLSWNMYVETGFAGYYNIQHFESPGIEWASEVYFLEDGTGELYAGSSTPITFTYPKDTWFQVLNKINIDADLNLLYIDGVLVHSWPFSNEASSTGGTNQLGGVDFFAGAVTGETPKAYFDDISFIQMGGAAVPMISVSPAQFQVVMPQGTSNTETLTIENIGTADLEYSIAVIYDFPGLKRSGVALEGNTEVVRSLGYSPVSKDPDAKPAPYNPADRDYVLHYDGDNASAIGWSSAPITVTVAAMFPNALTVPHAGTYLTSVDLYINDPGTNYILKIYDMGTSYQPGTLLVSQAFAGMSLSWNNVILDSPVLITGADIWVGYQFTQPTTDIFIPGTDAGPSDPNGDFLSTGVGWSHLSSNPDLAYNWNIRANLTGDPISQWLTVNPASGIVAPGELATVDVNFNATGMDVGSYYAHLLITSNDPENSQIEVPVVMVVTEGGTLTSVILDFEDVEDWVLTFDEWTTNDVDGGDTYGITDYSFPGMGSPMAYIAFNPATVTPPMTEPDIQPHGGVRFGACMATIPTPYNDDWLISPQITLGMNSFLDMWVKSYTDAYGLETYQVGVSTTGNDPADFTIISGPTDVGADAWENVNIDLSAYDGQTVYVAINCVSEDRFIFMVDDVAVSFYVGVPEGPEAVSLSIYPNPATDHVTINSGVKMSEVNIYNYLGQNVYSKVVKDNTFELSTIGFESGVYVARIKTEQGDVIRKITIR